MVIHTCNSSGQEAEVGKSRIPRWTELYIETLSQETKQNQKQRTLCSRMSYPETQYANVKQIKS